MITILGREATNAGVRRDYRVKRGAALEIVLDVLGADGQPFSMANATSAQSMIRRLAADSGAPLATATYVFDTTVANRLRILYTQEQIDALTYGARWSDPLSRYAYDIKLITPRGNAWLQEGLIHIDGAVTR